MELWKTLRILLHRWYIVLPLLLVTLVGVFGAVTSIAPDYKSNGTIVLIPTPTGANPFTDPSSLGLLANLLTTTMNNPATTAQLVQAGSSANYKIDVSGSPLIQITATAATPQQAKGSVKLVIDEFNRELAARQEKVRPDAVISSELITAPTDAVAQQGSRIRVAAGLLAVGLGLAILFPLAMESIVERRRRDRRILDESAPTLRDANTPTLLPDDPHRGSALGGGS